MAEPARGRARRSARVRRSARARGLRTLQHQSLPAATHYAIDTEVWFRALVLEQWGQRDGAPDALWATKDRVHDEAIGWFLDRQGDRPLEQRARRAGRSQDLTFWLDSRLLGRARRLAALSGMRLAHLLESAMNAYVSAHVSEELLAFRRRVRAEAGRLHRARTRGGTRTGAGSRARVRAGAGTARRRAPVSRIGA